MNAAALLLSAALAALTVYGEKKRTPRIRRVNLILGLAGAALILLAAGLCLIRCCGAESVPETARASLAGYGLTAGTVFAASFLFPALSLLLRRAEKKGEHRRRSGDGFRIVRVLVSLFGSAACLLLTALWIGLTRGNVPDFTAAYALCGVGLALTLRLPLSAEYLS